MHLLLDTHALLWWVSGDERISQELQARIADRDAVVYVSATSAWEMAIKARSGKLDPGPLLPGFSDQIERQGFVALPIVVEHAERAGLLPAIHNDPFDRVLIAQALVENLRLVSNERIFDAYGIVRLW